MSRYTGITFVDVLKLLGAAVLAIAIVILSIAPYVLVVVISAYILKWMGIF